MKGARLTELPVKHLEYLFSPPGLPLPVKGESEQGTTSILVRGGAGTGKTTFALALGHAIAASGGGIVLYLTTEFSPVEIAFKATLIGLDEEAVHVFPGAEGMSPGDVAVEHLAALRHGQPGSPSAKRKRNSIDAVWSLLHLEKPGERRPPLPVCAVVIDALTLPQTGESEETLRAHLVGFIEALENEGISVVFVEELAPGASAWSSFVVDVVFELSFHPEPEMQELRRKLTLPKSRHALSIPGPHDYGLDSGVLAVWPDLFRVMTGGHGQAVPRLLVADPLRLYVPSDMDGNWIELGAGIVLSPSDKIDTHAIKALAHTPGVKSLNVHCGVKTSVGRGPHGVVVYDSEGPHAIGWAILSVAEKAGTNVCILHDLDRLLSRAGWATLVLHMLEGLRQVGLTVCVHSPYDAMEPALALADLVWGTGKARRQALSPRRHRAFVRQCVRTPWMAGYSLVTEQLSQIESAKDLETLRAVRTAIDGVAASSAGAIEGLRLATAREWMGSAINHLPLRSLLAAGGKEGHHAAWLALLTGADWHAARAALAAVETEVPAPMMLLLWKAVCAAIAKNPSAIAELQAALASPEKALVLGPLLRGLAGTDQLEEADRIIADFGARRSLAPWMLERLRADVRLDAEDPAVLRDAVARLTALTTNASLPFIHSAETWHNLGTVHDRLGQHDTAIAAFERAATVNPFLDAARQELTRLQPPHSPP
jgi:hypothetical protein